MQSGHMTPSSHIIPDEWIVAYAAGTLSEAKSALVACHIGFHDELKQKLSLAEDVGGALLDSGQKAPVSADMFDKISAQMDAQCIDDMATGSITPSTATKNTLDMDGIPTPLRTYMQAKGISPKWRFMAPGMRQAKLHKEANGERLWLFKAKGGTEMPKHDHNGQEMTLVLQGSYCVGNKRFKVGDMEIAAENIKDHEPTIDAGDDCICLVVSEAPIRLKTAIGRAVQPFIGL